MIDQEDETCRSDQQNENNSCPNYFLSRDRSRREIRPLQRLGFDDIIAYAFSIMDQKCDKEPSTYREAMGCKDSNCLYQAIKEEIMYLHKKYI